MKLPLDADVLIDIRPVDSLARADETKVSSLCGRRFGQPPRPGKWHIDDSAVY